MILAVQSDMVEIWRCKITAFSRKHQVFSEQIDFKQEKNPENACQLPNSSYFCNRHHEVTTVFHLQIITMSENTDHPTPQQIQQLCRAVEEAMGAAQLARSDFDRLQGDIFNRLHIHISATTLKRLWGYVATDSVPRQRTLDTLAQFIGYNNFRHFCQTQHDGDGEPSAPVLSRHIDVENDLVPDDTLTIFWNPGRVCSLKYLGDRRFLVTESQNTRLTAGATFQCSLIIEGEPLYISNLVLNNHEPVGYICGKKGGIQFNMQKART